MSTLFLRLVIGNKAVVGDAETLGFDGQIVLDSFSWKTDAKHQPVGTEARTTVTHGHIRVTKVFDRASTALYGYMREHQEFDSATITLTDATGQQDKPRRMMEMAVRNCYITGLSARASDAGSVMKVAEDMTLSFESGALRYFPALLVGDGRQGATTYDITESRSTD